MAEPQKLQVSGEGDPQPLGKHPGEIGLTQIGLAGQVLQSQLFPVVVLDEAGDGLHGFLTLSEFHLLFLAGEITEDVFQHGGGAACGVDDAVPGFVTLTKGNGQLLPQTVKYALIRFLIEEGAAEDFPLEKLRRDSAHKLGADEKGQGHAVGVQFQPPHRKAVDSEHICFFQGIGGFQIGEKDLARASEQEYDLQLRMPQLLYIRLPQQPKSEWFLACVFHIPGLLYI